MWANINAPGNNEGAATMMTQMDSVWFDTYQGSSIRPGPANAFTSNQWNHLVFIGDAVNQTSEIIVFKPDGNVVTQSANSFSFGSHTSLS